MGAPGGGVATCGTAARGFGGRPKEGDGRPARGAHRAGGCGPRRQEHAEPQAGVRAVRRRAPRGAAPFPGPLIKEKLSQGVTLVVDRYAFSGVAFTSAKENFSLHWCKQPDVGLPKPDLVVFLQLRLAEAARRGEFGRERYENGSFQKRALQSFRQLMGDETLNWRVVDASRSIEDVHKEIRELCEDTIQAAMHRPLGELWT
ncbi:thymidylate kinase isoform X2 [Rhinolophus ferrumequinum]|uniref:thymidylate kinase isoform X2 n=1 Tax=Rhinolophus ferrumequinum TaxID=59479 RepID=UPI00140FE6D7|nr:thymidylate kinase isoform X2 [Rhinolophus ferrumequinum]